ncbi:MAG: hypothetical protein AAGF73_08735 [Actinomycetota bacterium]
MSGTDLVADARRIAGYHAVESAMFVATGRWIRSYDEPSQRTRIAVWNHQHAEHAALWAARYPTIEELPPIDAAVPATAAATIEAVTDLGTVASSVLPRLADAYRDFAVLVDARLDGPTARILDRVRSDIGAQLAEVQAISEHAVDSADDEIVRDAVASALADLLP